MNIDSPVDVTSRSSCLRSAVQRPGVCVLAPRPGAAYADGRALGQPDISSQVQEDLDDMDYTGAGDLAALSGPHYADPDPRYTASRPPPILIQPVANFMIQTAERRAGSRCLGT